MNIYLILVFIYVVIGILADVNKSLKRKKIYLIFVFGTLTLISVLRKYSVGTDLTLHYYDRFTLIKEIAWKDISNKYYEIGYTIFNKLLSLISEEPQMLIIGTSICTIPVFGWFIYKNSNHVVESVFIFLCYNLFFMYLNIIRQTLAIAILLIGIECALKNKKYILYTIFVILATSFHSSAILMVLMVPVSMIPFKKDYIFIVIAVTILLTLGYEIGINIFSSLAGFQKDYSYYLYERNLGGYGVAGKISIFISIIVFLFVYYSLYYSKNKENNGDNKILLSNNIQMYCIIFSMIFIILGMRISIAERLAHYFLPFWLVAIPSAIDKFKIVANNRIIVVSIINAIFLFYYLFILFTERASILYGVVPFEFFWQ